MLLILAMAHGAELAVPTDHATIDDALAASVSGDTIRIVRDHTESVDVDVDGITILGVPGVVLTAGSTFALDVLSGVSVTVRDLTIDGDSNDPYMEVSGDALVEDVVFTDCDGGNGGSMHVPDPGNATILRSTFTANSASRGAHIYAFGPSLIIEDCVF